MNILIIEDDAAIRQELKLLLENALYQVTVLTEFHHVVEDILQMEPDLILLDVNLPQQSGFEICKSVRKTSDVPIIFLTSRTDSMDELSGMLQGGDDYITKPFDNQELLVRIEAVLRRFQKSTTPNNSKTLRFKDLSLDTEAMEAKIRNTPITLTRYEYLILQLLMSSPSKVFTKNNIFESVWNENFIGDDNAINVHIGNLRKKFAKVNPEEKYIQTVWGLGFKMQG